MFRPVGIVVANQAKNLLLGSSFGLRGLGSGLGLGRLGWRSGLLGSRLSRCSFFRRHFRGSFEKDIGYQFGKLAVALWHPK